MKIPTYQLLIIALIVIVILSIVLSKLNFSVNLGKTPEDYEIEQMSQLQSSEFLNTQQSDRALQEQIDTDLNQPSMPNTEFVDPHTVTMKNAEKDLEKWTKDGNLGGEKFTNKTVTIKEDGIKNAGNIMPDNPMFSPMSQPNFPAEHNNLARHFALNNPTLPPLEGGNSTLPGSGLTGVGGGFGVQPHPMSGVPMGDTTGYALTNNGSNPNLVNQFNGREKAHNIATDYNWGYKNESTMNGGSLGVPNSSNGLAGFAPSDTNLSPFMSGGGDKYAEYVVGRSGTTCPPKQDVMFDDIRMGMGNPNIATRHST